MMSSKAEEAKPAAEEVETNMAAEEAETNMAAITLSACTLGGNSAIAEISSSESVGRLKELLAPQLEEGLEPRRLKLGLGAIILQDKKVLADYGLADKAELAAFIIPPAPAWAEKQGFTGEHPTILREFYAKYGMNMKEEWSTNDGVWQALAEAQERIAESQAKLLNWNNKIELFQDGTPAPMLRAAPGEELNVSVHGSIWNKNGDSCIHQLMLIMDKAIIAELNDSVPGDGEEIDTSFRLLAPSEPGTYLLWQNLDLQYSMRDARANTERWIAALEDGKMPDKYPGGFVGWLIVE
mmetsp:Transcript_46515/g.84047  ORF Transcript_46515/g.84047 Transcript_46515/m.84047 type:complete len:296 (+) Transcript_46515:63-950(+)